MGTGGSRHLSPSQLVSISLLHVPLKRSESPGHTVRLPILLTCHSPALDGTVENRAEVSCRAPSQMGGPQPSQACSRGNRLRLNWVMGIPAHPLAEGPSEELCLQRAHGQCCFPGRTRTGPRPLLSGSFPRSLNLFKVKTCCCCHRVPTPCFLIETTLSACSALGNKGQYEATAYSGNKT